VESYDYLGLGTVVRRARSQPGVDLTFIKQGAEGNGEAGDQYAGLDRFGRVVDQRWIKSGTALDRFQCGYDRDSNRLWRDNLVATAMGELYGYDNLNQLTSFDRGTLNGTKTGLTGSASRSQDFDFDALGNWGSLTNDGGSPHTGFVTSRASFHTIPQLGVEPPQIQAFPRNGCCPTQASQVGFNRWKT
jgi:hypothetical protein